jgi:hypothetical protein
VSWIDVLSTSANDLWADGNRALLLSKVPEILRRSGVDVRQALGGQRLLQALETQGKNKLRLIQNESQPLSWAIIPLHVSATEPYSKYFPQPRGVERESVSEARFRPAVWRAFTHEIPAAHRRYIQFSGVLRYVDIQESDQPPANAREVKTQDIRLQAPAGEVAAAIEEWASSNGIDRTMLLAHRSRPETSASDEASASSILEAMISALSPEDLKKISMPLDVVAQLLQRSR